MIVLLFFAVIVITAVLFSGWVMFSILRLVGRGVAACFGPVPRPSPRVIGNVKSSSTNASYVRCTLEKCRHANPTAAHFCRRCGHALPAPQRVAVSRAAMF